LSAKKFPFPLAAKIPPTYLARERPQGPTEGPCHRNVQY
jgi:hypothetical protein